MSDEKKDFLAILAATAKENQLGNEASNPVVEAMSKKLKVLLDGEPAKDEGDKEEKRK